MKSSKKYFFKEFKKWLLFNAIPLGLIFSFFHKDMIKNLEDVFFISINGIWAFSIPLYFLENLKFKKIILWFLFGIFFPIIIIYTLFQDFKESIYMSLCTNPIMYFMFSSVYNAICPKIILDFKEKRYFKLTFFIIISCFYIILQYVRMKAHINK
ncbi:MAG: hypothetical protein JW924_14565 [Fusobacteriaceae bacterium]|nr:hypothetical protein [Fusobacteriaceae bacterium]